MRLKFVHGFMDISFVSKIMNTLPGVQNARLAQPKKGAGEIGAEDQ